MVTDGKVHVHVRPSNLERLFLKMWCEPRNGAKRKRCDVTYLLSVNNVLVKEVEKQRVVDCLQRCGSVVAIGRPSKTATAS